MSKGQKIRKLIKKHKT